jgi:hypothetical protein
MFASPDLDNYPPYIRHHRVRARFNYQTTGVENPVISVSEAGHLSARQAESLSQETLSTVALNGEARHLSRSRYT